MFGFGLGQILIILVIALIFLGPEQLPQVARNVARFLNELKRGADAFKDEFMSDINDDQHHRNRRPQQPPQSVPQQQQSHVEPPKDEEKKDKPV